MGKFQLSLAVCAVALTSLIGSSAAWAYKGEELAKQSKVSLERARVIALKVFPGKIIDEELEKENGGSGLRYSFDIRQGELVHEVGVDAADGEVLENSDESKDKD